MIHFQTLRKTLFASFSSYLLLSSTALAQSQGETDLQTTQVQKAAKGDQGASASSNGDYFPDELLPERVFQIDPDKRKTEFDLGLGVISFPGYLGSDEQKTLVVPYFNANYKGRWFINPVIGAGFNAVDNKHLTLSGGLNYMGGRDADETPFDYKEFDIDGGVSVFGNALIGLKYAALNVNANLPFTGDVEGYEIETRLLTLLPLSKTFKLSPSVGVRFHGKDWHNGFYGVSPEQSVYTQTPTLKYSSGLTSYGTTLIGFWTPSEKYQVVGLVNYQRLADEFEDSPLVARKDGWMGVVALARRF